MPKMRVHELAKQLDKPSKDIITFLQNKNIEVKNHMSTLEDNQIQIVKNNFSETNHKEKQDSPQEEQVKKKSNISQVFHPQNSQSRQRTAGNRNNRMQNDNRPTSKEPLKKPTMETEKARQDVEVKQNTADRIAKPANAQINSNQMVNKPLSGEKTTVRENSSGEGRNHTNQSASRPNQGNRYNQGSRPTQGSHTNQSAGRPTQGSQSSQGSNRPTQGGNRPTQAGNRPTQGGNRPTQAGNRPTQAGNRPTQTGNRPTQGGNRPTQGGNRPTQGGNRPTQAGNRPNQAGNRPTQAGNRPNQTGNRPNQGGNRPNQGGNRPNQGGRRPNQGGRYKNRQAQPAPVQKQEVQEETIKTINLPEYMTIRELAEKMKVQPSVIVKKLFLQGKAVTVNQEVDFAQAEEIALEFNCIAEAEVKVDVIAELLKEDEEEATKMAPRPPVVCVMGHVDHGKTSLLDAIRDTHVIDREAGGITQHIGAYVVSINGQKITFLDTPGHEAFTSMRMRGANATDIAILVVAADDGVMPQTIEAINHAKAAEIEIIVAINKIDKPSANVERVKQELAEHELIAEDWGGSTIFVPVSAHTHEGMDELLEMILLTAEVCELKANAKRNARGLVIEAELDKGKGPVATVLVQKGTLRVGDAIAAGSSHGKVRAMMDDKGRRVKEAGPSTPVEILGLNDVPNAGEIFVAMENDKEARSFAETFISQGRERMLDDTRSRMSLDDLFTQIQAGNLKELDIIVKADVQGSVEAVKQSLVKLSNEEVVVKVIHGGVGAINESDVILASASNAIIIGFNVRPDVTAKEIAEREGVDLRLYKVIYNAIEDVEAAMKGMLDPIFEEKIIGHAEVRQTFMASGVGTIAGSYVLDGFFERGCKIRITREGELIFDGLLASLKRFKDDVKEVKTGYECGLVPDKFSDINEGDIFEAYKMVEVPR